MDSSAWQNLLLDVQIKAVLEFPPRLSFKRRVNVDSRNGTGPPFPKAVITFPRIVKLRFIFLASSKTLPVLLSIDDKIS